MSPWHPMQLLTTLKKWGRIRAGPALDQSYKGCNPPNSTTLHRPCLADAWYSLLNCTVVTVSSNKNDCAAPQNADNLCSPHRLPCPGLHCTLHLPRNAAHPPLPILLPSLAPPLFPVPRSTCEPQVHTANCNCHPFSYHRYSFLGNCVLLFAGSQPPPYPNL